MMTGGEEGAYRRWRALSPVLCWPFPSLTQSADSATRTRPACMHAKMWDLLSLSHIVGRRKRTEKRNGRTSPPVKSLAAGEELQSQWRRTAVVFLSLEGGRAPINPLSVSPCLFGYLTEVKKKVTPKSTVGPTRGASMWETRRTHEWRKKSQN